MRTACYGKWHLGHHPKFLPTNHGFDEYFGLPYSNDMWPNQSERQQDYPNLPLFDGLRVVDPKVTGEDQAQLTTMYTERAVQFIEKNKDRPFSHLSSSHHGPRASVRLDKFRGKTGQGMYADVVTEIDWSVGEILDTLRKHELDRRTRW